MKPKAKAKELIKKFGESRVFALIAVEEIQTTITAFADSNGVQVSNAQNEFDYWQEVKEEIKK